MEPGYMLSIYTGSGEKGRKIRDLIFTEAKKNRGNVSRFLLNFLEEHANGTFGKALKKLLRG